MCQITCPAGYHAHSIDSSCRECPAGYYSNAEMMPQCVDCNGRPKANTDTGQTSSTAACGSSPCPKGKAAASTVDSTCDTCDSGKFQDLDEPQHYGCKYCPAGWQFVSASAGCERCAAGKYRSSSTDATSCENMTSLCPAGTFFSSASASDTELQMGSTADDAACKACPSGLYQAVQNQSAIM